MDSALRRHDDFVVTLSPSALRLPFFTMRLFSLEGRFLILLGATAPVALLVYLAITVWPLPAFVQWASAQFGGTFETAWLRDPRNGVPLTLIVMLPLCAWLAHQTVSPLRKLLRALEGAVASYRDGDFSISIASRRRDELGALVKMHNALGATLREQRQNLAQRELLLDTVVQNTPVALVLTDGSGRVAYANIAARHLFNEGRSLNGLHFATLIADAPEALRKATEGTEDALFSVEMDGSEETFHLSQ